MSSLLGCSSLQLYSTAWPLLSVKGGTVETLSPDLAAAAVRALCHLHVSSWLGLLVPELPIRTVAAHASAH